MLDPDQNIPLTLNLVLILQLILLQLLLGQPNRLHSVELASILLLDQIYLTKTPDTQHLQKLKISQIDMFGRSFNIILRRLGRFTQKVHAELLLVDNNRVPGRFFGFSLVHVQVVAVLEQELLVDEMELEVVIQLAVDRFGLENVF